MTAQSIAKIMKHTGDKIMFRINSLNHKIRWFFYNDLHGATHWQMKNGNIIVHFCDGDTMTITSDEIVEAHDVYDEAYN
jgi:hypothetical protein